MAHRAHATISTVEGPRSRTGWLTTFRAFRNRSYRYLWLGQVGHSASIWMEQVVRPLLVLHLTGSALQVGLLVAVRMAPLLIFGLIAGAVADRYNKRRVMLGCQIGALLMQLTLGLLILSGLVEVWHVFVTGFLSGAATAFERPARQALLPRLVPREDLLNALALNNAAMNIMRVGGAGLAGLLLIPFDYGEVYLLDALIYLGIIWTTLRVVVPEDGTTRKHRESLLSDLLEGFRYMSANRKVLYLVAMALILFILGHPYQQVFIPLIAIDVLGVGRSGVGWMLALTGVGALAGSLTVASKGHVPYRGLVMSGVLIGFSLALILLAQSRWLPLSALALLLAGGTMITYLALNNSLLLEQTPPEFHGRVMSLMSLDRGLVPIGAIIGGALAETLGPQPGLTILAGACLTLTLLTFLFAPVLRKMA